MTIYKTAATLLQTVARAATRAPITVVTRIVEVRQRDERGRDAVERVGAGTVDLAEDAGRQQLGLEDHPEPEEALVGHG